MREMMRKLLIVAAFALAPSMARAALAAPTGLSAGGYINGTMPMSWAENTAVTQWYIYVDGNLLFQPFRSQTTPSSIGRTYLMQPLPPQAKYVITMKALAPGQPISAESAAITVTGQAVTSGSYFACLTMSATGAAANGVTVVAAIAGKTIYVTGWSISTNTAGSIVLHHQGGAGVPSNSTSNFIGGGYFAAGGGETSSNRMLPGLAPGQPVCVDVSAAMSVIYVFVTYQTN